MKALLLFYKDLKQNYLKKITPFQSISYLFLRFRYPVSLPEDVAKALGIPFSNFLTFNHFIKKLICLKTPPTRLIKFMPRNDAELAFRLALRKERFKNHTHFSYYFNRGWLEFVLYFDEQSLLRRVYVQHKDFNKSNKVEISLINNQKKI